MKQAVRAFTLVEVMVVMAIIAVLAMLIIGSITLVRRTSRETIHRNNAKVAQIILEYYTSRHGGKYPVACPRKTEHCATAGSLPCVCNFEDTEHDFGLGATFGTSGSIIDVWECQTTFGGNDFPLTMPGLPANHFYDVSGGGLIEYRASGYIIHIGNYNCTSELEHWDSI